ncbi:MAG: hypothetical protein LUD14_09255 [Clostridiales bacterium]|nr:hypothetical protein [Clostridiales bacterium]
MIGTCALCRNQKELQLSHIIPKFVGKYLKETSVGNIRSQEDPNRVVQDIEKHYLLCHDCEELFSASERYFANNLFYPYHKDKVDSFTYDEQLFYFITSLSWRSLNLDLTDFVREGDLKLDVLETMIHAEEIMRDYLLKSRGDIETIEHHIYFFDRIKSVGENAPEIYYNGSPHVTVHRSLTSYSGYADNTVYTISNLMGIIIVTLYSMDVDEKWTGTQIYREGGTLLAKNQGMQSRLGGELQYWMEQKENSAEKMTERTQERILKKITDVGEGIKDYAIFQDVLDDKGLQE